MARIDHYICDNCDRQYPPMDIMTVNQYGYRYQSTELHICRHCYVNKSINLYELSKKVRDREKDGDPIVGDEVVK